MRRGEIWTIAGRKGYAGKPRPVVTLQDDRFDATASITLCGLATDPTAAPLFRLPIEPNPRNGLRTPCRVMVDKITTVPRSKIGSLVWRLDDEDVLRLNRAIWCFWVSLARRRRPQRVVMDHPGGDHRKGSSWHVLVAYEQTSCS
jgi:mRNA interferase MazF